MDENMNAVVETVEVVAEATKNQKGNGIIGFIATGVTALAVGIAGTIAGRKIVEKHKAKKAAKMVEMPQQAPIEEATQEVSSEKNN